jgi:hypothetical protein
MKIKKSQQKSTNSKNQITGGRQDAVSLFEKFVEFLASTLPKKTQPFRFYFCLVHYSPSHNGGRSRNGFERRRPATTSTKYFTTSPTSDARGQT